MTKKNIENELVWALMKLGEFHFIPTPGDTESMEDEPGLLHTYTSLSALKRDLDESNDEVILNGLERLALAGKIRIFNVGVSKGMSIYDCGFGIEIGQGARRWGKGSGTRLHSVGSGEIFFT